MRNTQHNIYKVISQSQSINGLQGQQVADTGIRYRRNYFSLPSMSSYKYHLRRIRHVHLASQQVCICNNGRIFLLIHTLICPSHMKVVYEQIFTWPTQKENDCYYYYFYDLLSRYFSRRVAVNALDQLYLLALQMFIRLNNSLMANNLIPRSRGLCHP